MNETYRLRAIVLGRETFRENDLLVDLLTEEGRLRLVARGAKKFKSKIAAHVEPFSLIEAMAIRGKNYDYLGSAISAEVFSAIKSDLDKLKVASEAVNLVKESAKEYLPEPKIWHLLLDFLINLNLQTGKISNVLIVAFRLQLRQLLGFGLDFELCGVCGKRLADSGNLLNISQKRLIHDVCRGDLMTLTVSSDCIKILKILSKSPFVKLKVRLKPKAVDELNQVV